MGDRKQGVGNRERRTGNTSFISSLPTTRSPCEGLSSCSLSYLLLFPVPCRPRAPVYFPLVMYLNRSAIC